MYFKIIKESFNLDKRVISFLERKIGIKVLTDFKIVVTIRYSDNYKRTI